MENRDANVLAESRAIWDANAENWDQRIGGGGGWQTLVIAPTVERMLDIQSGENVLDIACGNGQFSRRLADLGAKVAASDFSPKMIELARERSGDYADRVRYSVVDATDEAQVLSMAAEGERFDAGVSNMALMDMPAIEPMFRAVAKLLKPEGRFVFSVAHPCFNGFERTMQPELPDYDDTPTYTIKIRRYLSATIDKGLAIPNQPKQQYYWHRPLHSLLNSAFTSGLVMDWLEEPPIPVTDPSSKGAFNWANYDMPPILFVRLRPR